MEASMANDHVKVQSLHVQSSPNVSSQEIPAIPAVDPRADSRSDGGGNYSEASPIAPTAQASRRSFVMNSIVSGASLASAVATATAVEALPVTPPVQETSFPDLVARFLRAREREIRQRASDKAHSKILHEAFHRETGVTMAEYREIDHTSPRWTELTEAFRRVSRRNPDKHNPSDEDGCSIAWSEISDELHPLTEAMLAKSPKSVVDIAWQAEALYITDAEVQESQEFEWVRQLIANIHAFAWPSGYSSAKIGPRDEEVVVDGIQPTRPEQVKRLSEYRLCEIESKARTSMDQVRKLGDLQKSKSAYEKALTAVDDLLCDAAEIAAVSLLGLQCKARMIDELDREHEALKESIVDDLLAMRAAA
jgi:hypothetical protein